MGTESGAKRAPSPALMRATGLSKRYVQARPFSRTRAVVNALAGVDLEIPRYGITAIVGESGSGKSTLAACLGLLEAPDEGAIGFDGNEICRDDRRTLALLRSRIQMIFQDSAGAMNPWFSAAQVIEEPLEIQRRVRGHQLRARACELMEEVGLSADWADRPCMQFSGGQKQRLAIARAISLQPEFLILDEALSGLDLITQAQILDLLLDLQQKRCLTYLVISHDLGVVKHIADFIVVMQNGRVVEQGPRGEILERSRHGHTRQLLEAAQLIDISFQSMEKGKQR